MMTGIMGIMEMMGANVIYVLGALAVGGLTGVLLVLLLRASSRASAPLDALSGYMQDLARGQEGLRASIQTVSETAANGQSQLAQIVERRLSEVQQNMQDRLAENATRAQRSLSDLQERMNETLHGSAKEQQTSLTRLQERLQVIDKAQDNIMRISNDVLSLQDILSNKQTRGAFGEIQLHDILLKALPPDSYTWQAQLSNGSRPDCLIHMPSPPGPIVIDSKFPLEAYEALRAATTTSVKASAQTALRAAVRKHIKDIAEKYIIEGETAGGALMFLPSEAVYAELHANFSDVVRIGFESRVWIVSPTTCMATLNTMRAVLKDARMRAQAGAIRKELGALVKDLGRLEERIGSLDRNFGLAARNIEDIKISTEKSSKRAKRLDNFDFEEFAPQESAAELIQDQDKTRSLT